MMKAGKSSRAGGLDQAQWRGRGKEGAGAGGTTQTGALPVPKGLCSTLVVLAVWVSEADHAFVLDKR